MADGDYVEIQCEGAQPDDEGRIQWFFNNRVRPFSTLDHEHLPTTESERHGENRPSQFISFLSVS